MTLLEYLFGSQEAVAVQEFRSGYLTNRFLMVIVLFVQNINNSFCAYSFEQDKRFAYCRYYTSHFESWPNK